MQSCAEEDSDSVYVILRVFNLLTDMISAKLYANLLDMQSYGELSFSADGNSLSQRVIKTTWPVLGPCIG